MKRVLALILTICLLFALSACNTAGTPTETTQAPAAKTNVAEPLTWEKINALPIANNDMTEEELRQLVLDYMNMQMQFTWTPSQKTDMVNVEKRPDRVVKTFHPGQVYGGTPYLTAKCSNLYTMMEFYDERNGMLDLSGGQETLNLCGNQCSSSTFWAWSRVCASCEYDGSSTILQENGCLPVGPYTYTDEDITGSVNRGYSGTDLICEKNGMQTMFESYALTKPADGLVVSYSRMGHVRMVASYPKVVRDANGNIDGTKSTLTYTDQDGQYYPTTQVDGTPYEHVGGHQVEISFAKLYTENYIPFTFAELNKDRPVEKSEISMDYTGETINLYQLSLANVTCNYSISDLTVVVKDEKGNQVFRKLTPMHDNSPRHKTVNVGKAANSFDLADFTDGKHTIEISARIGTGEKPVVYTGTLVN